MSITAANKGRQRLRGQSIHFTAPPQPIGSIYTVESDALKEQLRSGLPHDAATQKQFLMNSKGIGEYSAERRGVKIRFLRLFFFFFGKCYKYYFTHTHGVKNGHITKASFKLHCVTAAVF